MHPQRSSFTKLCPGRGTMEPHLVEGVYVYLKKQTNRGRKPEAQQGHKHVPRTTHAHVRQQHAAWSRFRPTFTSSIIDQACVGQWMR